MAWAEAQWDGMHWELRLALRSARRNRDKGLRTGRRDWAFRLVAAARALAEEGDGQFTVEQIVDRAGTTVQTLYRHFGSKEELLLAVIEENIAEGTAALAREIDDVADPLLRLRRLIHHTIVSASAVAGSDARLRFHARERPRLAEQFPDACRALDAPYRRLAIDALARAAAAGKIFSTELERDADMLVRVTTAYSHAVGSGAIPGDPVIVADHVTDFCMTALVARAREAGGAGR